MNEKQAELTSALLDGELDHDDQVRAVAAVLAAGPEALERFGRYRLIGDVMRGESAVLASSVADQVRRALRDEPVVLAPRPRQMPSWLRPVAGVAVAASVAVGAVLVAPQLMTQTGQPASPVQVAASMPQQLVAPTLVSTGSSEEGAAPLAVAATTGRWQTLDQDLEDRLSRLVIEHNEFGGRTGINGPVPHIGFVSYDGR